MPAECDDGLTTYTVIGSMRIFTYNMLEKSSLL